MRLQMCLSIAALLGAGLLSLPLKANEATENFIRLIYDGAHAAIAQELGAQPLRIDLAYVNQDGASALHAAARRGRADLVERLVVLGAQVNLCTNTNATSLHIAAGLGNMKLVEALLALGADPNAADERGDTPLHVAAQKNDLEMIARLVVAGADPTMANLNLQTPEALFAHMNGLPQRPVSAAAKSIAPPTRRVKRDSSYMSFNVAESGDLSEWTLAKRHATVFDEGLTLLHTAIKAGREQNFFWLVENAAVDLQLATNTPERDLPIHLAARSSSPKILSYLLGDDQEDQVPKVAIDAVNSAEQTALMLACQQPGGASLVKALLLAGASTVLADRFGMTAVHHAATAGNASALSLLIEHGADLRGRTRLGAYPIHLVAAQGSIDMMRDLLKLGIDINWADGSGRTALVIAAQTGRLDMVNFLLKNNAVVDLRDDEGFTAFLRAAQRDDVLMAALLLGRGADRMALAHNSSADYLQIASSRHRRIGGAPFVSFLPTPDNYESPVMVAARQGCRQTLLDLLMMNFPVNATNQLGLTALHFAAIGTQDSKDRAALVENYIRIMIDLMVAGADPCAEDRWGRTPYDLLKMRAEIGSPVHAAIVRKIGTLMLAVCVPKASAIEQSEEESALSIFGAAVAPPFELGATLTRRKADIIRSRSSGYELSSQPQSEPALQADAPKTDLRSRSTFRGTLRNWFRRSQPAAAAAAADLQGEEGPDAEVGHAQVIPVIAALKGQIADNENGRLWILAALHNDFGRIIGPKLMPLFLLCIRNGYRINASRSSNL